MILFAPCDLPWVPLNLNIDNLLLCMLNAHDYYLPVVRGPGVETATIGGTVTII